MRERDNKGRLLKTDQRKQRKQRKKQRREEEEGITKGDLFKRKY